MGRPGSRDCGHGDHRSNILLIIIEGLNVKTFAVRLAATAQVYGIYGQPGSHELTGGHV